MLTRLIQRKQPVAADTIEYEYEYRCTEYEYDLPDEQSLALEDNPGRE